MSGGQKLTFRRALGSQIQISPLSPFLRVEALPGSVLRVLWVVPQ